MKIVKFKNGNFNVTMEPQFDLDDKFSLNDREGNNLVFMLCNSAELDFRPCETLTDAYCVGLYVGLYNDNTGKGYFVTGSDMERWKQGKTVKLIGFDVNNEVIESMEE